MVDDSIAKRNVLVLVLSQMFLGAQMPILIIVGGLAGAFLADNKVLATLPISVMMLMTMLMAGPISLFMGRYGRRAGFLMGISAGAIGGLLGAYALFERDFMLLLVSAAFSGIYQSCHAYYRFAAADTASDEFKPRAISWVLAGGLGAALLGPELSARFHDYFELTPFAGAYLAIAALNIIFAPLMLFLNIPTSQPEGTSTQTKQPLMDILKRPPVTIAILCGMVSYALMTLVMTATPLAMQGCGFSTELASDVVRWHVVAMFAPSFFTGDLIKRFGVQPIIFTGLLMLAACGVVALMDIALMNFYVALILLGLGWNFGFIGATTLLASVIKPEERARIQGFNDFCVFGLVAFASFSSGGLLNWQGWDAVQLAMPPFLLMAMVGLWWLKKHPLAH
uniref:Putative membrane protein n=1 Tax=uncultured Thiotrichaceae bacterium TaxID=298394 RepID=A0A6S6UGF6_9GAMM|nr:MAG: putative membrane protein [uncultured Thiotrichaceae bacterium]